MKIRFRGNRLVGGMSGAVPHPGMIRFHAAPTGLGGLSLGRFYKHAAPTGLGGLSLGRFYKHAAPDGG
jgi:hypothetical protein